jgi:CheY-like chemotaxis protein
VRDSGIGVPPKLRDVLFQPFTQADSSTTRRFGGSGLGLSICRELATLMDGEVGCDSDGRARQQLLGRAAAARAGTRGRDARRRAPVPAQPLLGMRVLLAEDNPVNRLIVGAMLTAPARRSSRPRTGRSGARRVAVHADAARVLMDLHMPEIDGLEATRLLRAQEATAHLPVIALSAAVLGAERAQAHAAGMNGFVAKPAAEADLLRSLWAVRAGAAGWPTSDRRGAGRCATPSAAFVSGCIMPRRLPSGSLT